jgi:hypothetical protein
LLVTDAAMSNQDHPNPLQVCMETVHRLQEENEQLRRSAGAFGQLAERLSRKLQEERRAGAERRVTTRPASDRRAPIRSDG